MYYQSRRSPVLDTRDGRPTFFPAGTCLNLVPTCDVGHGRGCNGIFGMIRDHNLLFGVIAVQLGKVTPVQLMDLASSWASDTSRDLHRLE